jgi:hypothetical protein
VERAVLLLLLASGVHHNSFLFVFPVDEPEFFEFTAEVADRYDVDLHFFCEGVVGDASRLLKNQFEECEDLAVLVAVEVESKLCQLLQTF